MPARVLAAVLLLLACAFSASAGSITYQTVGVYGADVPLTDLSAPGENFQLIFTVSTPPAAGPGSLPGGFSTNVDSASVLFRGAQISLIPIYLEFFSDAQGGGYLFDGSSAVTDLEFSTITGQMFSGPPSAPFLLPGPFLVDVTDESSYVAIRNGTTSGFYTLASATIVTPEPATLLLAGLGLTAAFLRLRGRA